jgi:Tannase-like family of unknown function (DUF6351)
VGVAQDWVVMSTAMANNSRHCNQVTPAESGLTAKEWVIDQYGPR